MMWCYSCIDQGLGQKSKLGFYENSKIYKKYLRKKGLYVCMYEDFGIYKIN